MSSAARRSSANALEKGTWRMEKGKIIQSFEDLTVWQLAIELASTIYKIFEHSRDLAFKNQIQRAAISI